MVYLKYVENIIPLSKLIGLLFLFCLPLLSILFLKTKRNDLARPVMGTIFLVYMVWCVQVISVHNYRPTVLSLIVHITCTVVICQYVLQITSLPQLDLCMSAACTYLCI